MEESTDHKKEVLHDYAENRPRDEHGHFVPIEHTQNPQSVAQNPSHPVMDRLFPHGVGVDHKVTNDDLLDVHVGNPLRKITAILEEIKKQKAFSFTLKGSLGLAGIVLVLGTFGFFGGSHMLCSKGIRSEVGTVRILNAVDAEKRIPVISLVKDVFTLMQGKQIISNDTRRTVLIRQDGTIFHIPDTKAFLPPQFDEKSVIVTGELDSCSNTLTVEDSRSIQIY